MRLIVLAAPGPSTDILLNYLDDAGHSATAILMEPTQSRSALLRGRARRLGWRAVFGQVLFIAIALPFLKRGSVNRLKDIQTANGLSADPVTEDRVTTISSVNSPETLELLSRLAPDVVMLSGTRIVKPEVLKAAGAPVLNIHAGITPEFRGVHGGYWAKWTERSEDFGATLHVVDPGVDTGAVLEHVRPICETQDNFVTYPLLQLASALPALVKVLNRLNEGHPLPEPIQTNTTGQQWYHPTLGQYLTGLWRGVR